MAVERLPAVTTPAAVQPSRALRPAQQAFFEAALGKAKAAAPSTKITPLQEVPTPRQPLRPGSIVDIKV